jgi:hypothetical protein
MENNQQSGNAAVDEAIKRLNRMPETDKLMEHGFGILTLVHFDRNGLTPQMLLRAIENGLDALQFKRDVIGGLDIAEFARNL